MSENLQYTTVEGIKCYSPEVASAYTNYPDSGFDVTDKNSNDSFWVSARHRLFKSIVERYMMKKGKTKFLEIGCGTGDFIQQISKNQNLEITGSEIYLKGLVYAKKNIPSVDFVQFDVSQGKISEQYHIITAFDVIEHIDNDVAAIRNIKQMLKKDGVVVISVPQHMMMWSPLDELVKHKRRYSRAELVGKLITNGFHIELCTSFVFLLFPLMFFSRLIDKWRPAKQDSVEFSIEKRVKFSRVMNLIGGFFMRLDEWLINVGCSLPFGGTLVVVAKRI